ncbi:MAG TPA: hypothetical protein VFE60_04710 [Roseiarcus sp.]|nr:hypothetical protein [Roseiarcus sp.]
MKAKPNGSAAHVAEVRKRIERVPVGEARALLELKFGRVITDMAQQIRDAAQAKRK